MSWSPLQAPLEGRGLFTSIPADPEVKRDKGWAGWACFYNSDREYDCGRYYVSEDAFVKSDTVDLLNGDFEVDRGFWCHVNTDYIAYHTAKCINFMPKEAKEYPVGEYRWSPYSFQTFSQSGFVGERDTWFN